MPMLLSLSIRDFVIVDALELSFHPGFTVFTGETGAGKSILIDALNLALGERADPAAVREGKERAEISAEFDLGQSKSLREWLAANDLVGEDSACLVRRVVESAGRSRAYINGRPVTVQQLRELGNSLVAVHGQFAHQALLQPNAQQQLLDDFAGASATAQAVADTFEKWNAIKKQRIQWQTNAAALEQERTALEFQRDELVRLDFQVESWQELLSEHSRLNHAASLIDGVQAAQHALDESDEALLPQINAVTERLKNLSEFDAELKNVIDVLEPATLQLQESVYALRHYARRLEIDPARLKEVESRMEAVQNMARKYRVRPPELVDMLARCAARLAELGGSADIDALLVREQQAEAVFSKAANELTAQRKKAAKKLAQAITAAMQTLAMQGGQFTIELAPRSEPNANGNEHVTFCVAGHAGVTPGPLDKIASGGELSRIGLALQVVMSKVARVPTLIFDEVDAGIGGGVAEVVGKLLRELGANYQVMCVTHLPQVAAQAQHHMSVSKSTHKGCTRSSVNPLRAKDRIDEIARMLGGVKITEATRKHAAEMLSSHPK
jgi:DNA repair protein RecN (Recombination protein N)